MEWFVYLLRCGDQSLYTGITKDVDARLKAHREGKGAKYTRGRGPIELIDSQGPYEHKAALFLERSLKRLPRDQKIPKFRSLSSKSRSTPPD